MSSLSFYKIQYPEKINMQLTHYPGTKEVEFHNSILQLKQAGGATTIITLLLEKEIYDNNISETKALYEEQGTQWFHSPIIDEGVPEKEFDQL